MVLPQLLAETLEEFKPSLSRLAGVAVTTGPGSFTGIRIGLAAAKGLALAIDRPLIGVSCFDAVARRGTRDAGATDWTIMAMVLETRRDDIYVKAVRRGGGTVIPASVIPPVTFAGQLAVLALAEDHVRLVGDAVLRSVETLAPLLASKNVSVSCGAAEPPDAVDVAWLAIETLESSGIAGTGYVSGLVPDYLGRPYATVADR